MIQPNKDDLRELEKLATMGADAIAYMREMTAEEIISAFPDTPELEMGTRYWALFGADGTPLVLAHNQSEISSQAFYNDLDAVLPN